MTGRRIDWQQAWNTISHPPNILHVGILSIHVHRFIRYLERYWAGVGQEHVTPGEEPIRPFDMVIIHGIEQDPSQVERFDVPIVGWLWNELWRKKNEEAVLSALRRCSLVIADHEAEELEGVNTFRIRPLVDGRIFYYEGPVKNWPHRFLLSRLHQQDNANLYWTQEVLAALQGLPGVHIVTGNMSPATMADAFRTHQVVICTREDSGPSYTTIEACLCGAIPIVSDTPSIRKWFTEGGRWIGARGCTRNPTSIRHAIAEVLCLTPEERHREVLRNQKTFHDWKAAAQMPHLVEALKGVLCQPVPG